MKDIPGYEGLYAATEEGEIWSYPKPPRHQGLWLSKWVKKRGYEQVRVVAKDGKRNSVAVHRLIAITFLPNPDNHLEVNHKNGKRWDNRVENLEWCDRRRNMLHCYRQGLHSGFKGERSPHAKLNRMKIEEIKKLREAGLSLARIAKVYGVHGSTIGHVVRGETYGS